ncbi:MAG: Hsp70 family protein [Thermoguttaceae bacterium]
MHFEPGQTVGIDLGTTFSTVGQVDENGTPVAIPNEDGEVETASVILLTERGHVIVGPNRARAALEDPENVVERIKRHMGDVEYKRTFDGRPITPEFVSALILKKLKQDAEKRIGPIANAVITVPYYFNDARRKATEDAGRIAGLNVIDIMNEPTAATLTYAWKQGELGATGREATRPRRALIYDLGGGTFDVTVVRYTPTHFQVLATDGDVQLGGVDWNDRLLDYVADEFKARFGQDPRESPRTVQILRNECDVAKIELSTSLETTITCRHDGKSITVPVTREKFESLTADLLQRTADTTLLVLEQAKLTPKELDAVVLVGSATRMPQVPRKIAETLGREPYTGIPADVSVALGASIHAAILEARHGPSGSERVERVRKLLGSIRQENVNSHSLGIVVKDPRTGRKINHVMIPRNTRLPVEVVQTFETVSENQHRVTVQVMEGDAPDPAACSLLGKCRITDLPPGLPKGSPVEVSYAFNTSGRVIIKAREKTHGKQAAIEIERKGVLTEEEVDAFARLAAEYTVE